MNSDNSGAALNLTQEKKASCWPFSRPRHAETLRALAGTKDAGPPSFTQLEMLALSAIAYQQPVTRGELSRLVGHDISRDILGCLKSLGVIAPGPRAPQPGAPVAWVTTARFLTSSRWEACAICRISTRWTPLAPWGEKSTTKSKAPWTTPSGWMDEGSGLNETEPEAERVGAGQGGQLIAPALARRVVGPCR